MTLGYPTFQELCTVFTDESKEQKVLYELQYRAEHLRNAFTLKETRQCAGGEREIGHTPFERWSVDYNPAPLGSGIPFGQQQSNFNNLLLQLLAKIRQDKAVDRCQRHPPGVQEEVEKGTPLMLACLKEDLTNILSELEDFVSVMPQGSSSRATSIEDWAGYDWGRQMASDLDMVALFDGDATIAGLELLGVRLQGALKSKFKMETMQTGKYGLLLKLLVGKLEVEMDVIPAIADPRGGHWILDSSTSEVLHNHPTAVAEEVQHKIASTEGWADLVVLTKFWNKCHAVKCDDGKKRAPFSSLHLEATLLGLPGPLPERLDEAFLLALQFIRGHAIESPFPAAWTGRLVADYFKKDKKRKNNVNGLLKRQSDILESLISDPIAGEDQQMWKKVLGKLDWLPEITEQ